jgi:hypothetical protein
MATEALGYTVDPATGKRVPIDYTVDPATGQRVLKFAQTQAQQAPQFTPQAAEPDAFQAHMASLKEKGKDLLGRAGQTAQTAKEEILKPGGMFKNQAGAYRGAAGGKSGAALGAVGTLLSGDPLGAAVSAPVGVLAGMGANAATTALTTALVNSPNAGLKAAGMAARFLVPGLVGGAAQQATAGAVKAATGKVEAGANAPVGGTPMYVPGTSIALNQAGLEQNQFERDLANRLKEAQTMGNYDIAKAKEITDYGLNAQVSLQQRLQPIADHERRQNLIAAQQLQASQGAIYQNLGRQAGMFKLAGGAQAEAGATLRTMIANNPYANATLSAPSISFG